MLSVSKYQIAVGSTDFYSTGFRNLIENHLTYLLNHSLTKKITLPFKSEDVNTGDFYGLLNSLNIPQDLWWVTLRLNNLHSPVDYSGDLGAIYLPERSVIETLNTRFMNSTTLQ